MNGKYYVGQTKNLRTRTMHHFSASRSGRQSFPINKAIRKYGEENFHVEEVATANNQADLDNLEASWIIALSAYKGRFGYNRRLGGGGSSCCAETRELQSLAKRGKPSPKKGTGKTQEERASAKIMYSRKARAKIKAARALLPAIPRPPRVITEEVRRKMSESRRGKPSPKKGTGESPEVRRQKKNASARRKWADKKALGVTPPKASRKLSPEQHAALIERMRSPELRAKISAGKIGGKRPDNAARIKAVMFTDSANAKRRNTLSNYYQTERGKAHTQKAITARISTVTHEQLSEAGKKGNQVRWGNR